MNPGGEPASAPGQADRVRGPSAGLYFSEPIRGLAGLGKLPLAAPWLAAAPRGDQHGVLVLPGLLASDASTAVLRRFLRRLGYQVQGWNLGRNLGPTDEVLDRLPQRAVRPGRAQRRPGVRDRLEPGRRLRQGTGAAGNPARSGRCSPWPARSP